MNIAYLENVVKQFGRDSFSLKDEFFIRRTTRVRERFTDRLSEAHVCERIGNRKRTAWKVKEKSE